MTQPLLVTLAAASLIGLPSASAQDGGAKNKTGFIDCVYKEADGKEAKYMLFVPHGYLGDKDYPLILFLHGAGRSGTDGKSQIESGLGPAIKKNEKAFPFIVVFPQSQFGSWQPNSPGGARALAILAETQKHYKVDAKRIYLTGSSNGGIGTWSMAAAYPDRWAAIVPVTGRGDPNTAARIKDIPCWCFHGDADDRISVEEARDMIAALKKAGGSPKYDEYPGVRHGECPTKAYATKELYDWLLMQTRK